MTKRDYPSFGHWLDQGATVTWEKWNGQDSHNHPMFGGALMWFYNTLAGVRPDDSAPGFRHFTVKPVQAKNLPSASYSTMTPYGEVASEVAYTPTGEVSLTVTVPVGSTATVMVPLTREGMNVTLDGKPAEGGRVENGYYVTDVPQGVWSFRAQ